MLEVANRIFRQVTSEMYMIHIPPLTLSVIATLIHYTVYRSVSYAILTAVIVALLAIAYNEIMFARLMDEYRARLDSYYEKHPEAYSSRRRSPRLYKKIEERPNYYESEDSS